MPPAYHRAMPEVRLDESVTPAAHRAALLEGLRTGRLANRFHYAHEESASRWLALASSHSPAHDEVDGLRAYDDAHLAALAALPPGGAHVIGVACADGVKERRLLGALAATGRTPLAATPVDVSVPLVTAAAEAMAAVPGVDATHAVAVDVLVVGDLSPLLAPRRAGTRLVTMFGVLSTLGPSALPAAVSLLGPGDLLLVSANLLPDAPGARDAVMAQYDNPPTRHWLQAVLDSMGLAGSCDMAFRWDRDAHGPMVIGEVTARRAVAAEVDGVVVGIPEGGVLRVLESFRHTPGTLRDLLAGHGLDVLAVCASPSGEEGVALARRA